MLSSHARPLLSRTHSTARPRCRSGNHLPFRRLCASFGAEVLFSEMAFARQVGRFARGGRLESEQPQAVVFTGGEPFNTCLPVCMHAFRCSHCNRSCSRATARSSACCGARPTSPCLACSLPQTRSPRASARPRRRRRRAPTLWVSDEEGREGCCSCGSGPCTWCRRPRPPASPPCSPHCLPRPLAPLPPSRPELRVPHPRSHAARPRRRPAAQAT